MIIRLETEKNLNTAFESKLTKISDYQDVLTFKIPVDEPINVDELIGVRTKVFKQNYRVKEIIVKDSFKDVFCEHVFFDCKNIVIPYVDEANRHGASFNDFSRYTDIRSICGHLNRIIRTKGDNTFEISSDFNKSGIVECDDTTLYDLIFGEKGILKTFDCELVYDNFRVKFVQNRPSKNTEILFHENKNITELQETTDFKNIVTKLHVTCKHTPDNSEEGKAERERLKAEKRKQTFEASQQRIKEREKRQAEERERKRQERENEYQANKNRPKQSREQIHAEHLRKQQENENRIRANNEARRLERERKFREREDKRVLKQKNKEELIFRTVFTSPLISEYARPYEASLNFNSSEIDSEESLRAWCNANLFTEEDHRDVPMRNFSFKPTVEEYNVDINDRALVVFTSIGTRKVVNCCKLEYDALHDKYISIEFGILNRSPIKNAIGNLNSKISDAKYELKELSRIWDEEIEDYINKELEAFDEVYRIGADEFMDEFNVGIEESLIRAEQFAGDITLGIDKSIDAFKSEVDKTIDEFNSKLSSFDGGNLDELRKKIEETTHIAKTTLKMVGTDDSITYNKNRIEGATEYEIPLGTAYIEVSHNGDGFEVGKEYTISWEAECRTHDFTDVRVLFSKPLPFVARVSLVSKNNLYPRVDKVLEKGTQEAELLHVYSGTYTNVLLSDWLEMVYKTVSITDKTVLNVDISFKKIADANDRPDISESWMKEWQGEWAEQPQYILDGGVN